ncbi:MAG: hypothetical protein [Cotesia congregata filamentous virus 2]
MLFTNNNSSTGNNDLNIFNNAIVLDCIFSNSVDDILKKILRCVNLNEVIKKNNSSTTFNIIIASSTVIKKNKNLSMFEVIFNSNSITLHDIKPQCLLICMFYAMYISKIEKKCKIGIIFTEYMDVYDMLTDRTSNSYIILFIKKYCFVKYIK